MIFEYLKKQRDLEKKKKLIKMMILSLNISDSQKEMFLESLDIVNQNCVEQVYNNLINFTKNLEIKNLEDINKTNFIEIAGMRKKEAEEKKKDMNAFSFLINNL